MSNCFQLLSIVLTDAGKPIILYQPGSAARCGYAYSLHARIFSITLVVWLQEHSTIPPTLFADCAFVQLCNQPSPVAPSHWRFSPVALNKLLIWLVRTAWLRPHFTHQLGLKGSPAISTIIFALTNVLFRQYTPGASIEGDTIMSAEHATKNNRACEAWLGLV